MSHRHSDCKCYGCPEKDTAACPKRQAENQVKDLLVERKVLRETFVDSARKVAEQTPTNNARSEILALVNEAISLNDGGQPADATVILRDLLVPKL